MTLDVYFGNKLAGFLQSTDNRGVVFYYEEKYIADKNAVPLSASLPLRKEEFSQIEAIPFFSGLLPEEASRKKIADFLHISETSTFKLLEALGGECAGLITITASGNPDLPKDTYYFNSDNYELLDENRLADFIKKMDLRPLMKADDKLRLSLAGAQEKLALAKIDSKWYLPLNGAPSTHILKPTRKGSLSSLAMNEYICMKLAANLGLPAPDVDLINIADRDVFVVERYDRIKNKRSIQRLHQEDFCQAMGLMNASKYQSDGGPGIFDIFSVIKSNCSVPALEIQKFLKYIVFNYLIGNCDSHGKNYSILYRNRTVELAPLYDSVSTLIYSELTEKLSMKIGSHYEIRKVSKSDFYNLAQSLNIKPFVISKLFEEFKRNSCKAFDELKNDPKISKEVLEKIISVFQDLCIHF